MERSVALLIKVSTVSTSLIYVPALPHDWHTASQLSTLPKVFDSWSPKEDALN